MPSRRFDKCAQNNIDKLDSAYPFQYSLRRTDGPGMNVDDVSGQPLVDRIQWPATGRRSAKVAKTFGGDDWRDGVTRVRGGRQERQNSRFQNNYSIKLIRDARRDDNARKGARNTIASSYNAVTTTRNERQITRAVATDTDNRDGVLFFFFVGRPDPLRPSCTDWRIFQSRSEYS